MSYTVNTKDYVHDAWENDWYKCPNCGYDSIDMGFRYCPSCGEGLDFPDAVEEGEA